MRPELDHGLPGRGNPMVLTICDREENRRKRFADPSCERIRTRRLGDTPTREKPRAARRDATKKNRGDADVAKARAFDQFYTADHIAVGCLKTLSQYYDLSSYWLIEPSGGGGAFYRPMPENSLAFDVDPQSPGIIKADYLAIHLQSTRRIITVGNPPFGTVACLAVAFFNHAALHSDAIAMILPRSFLKASIENRLNQAFHLVHCEEVPPNAFRLAGTTRDVATIFQIWERRSVDRPLRAEVRQHPDFEFGDPDAFDFWIRRVGANAGTIGHDRNVHAKSHYFIKGDVEAIMAQLNLKGAARSATSTPSLAKTEIVKLYAEWVDRNRDSKDDQCDDPPTRMTKTSMPAASSV